MIKYKDMFKKRGISRNFVIYFFTSLILIFFIVFLIQWYAINWFVDRYENDRITDSLIKLKASLNEYKDEHTNNLLKLKDLYLKNKYSSKPVNQIIKQNINSNSAFYVFDNNDRKLLGDEWQFFTNQIKNIKQANEYFIISDKTNMYNVSYNRHRLKNSTLYYDFYLVSLYRQPINTIINYKSYTIDNLKNSPYKTQKLIYEKLINSEHTSDIMILPIDNVLSLGLLMQYDITANPAIVYVYNYPREVNLFFSRFMLLIIFILLALMVILSTVSSTIISKKIFLPLWNLIDKMKTISEKPELISPLNQKTHGEILQIYEYFNNMSIAVIEHQKQLNKSYELLEKINVGIFSLDSNLRIKHFNKALSHILETNNLDKVLIWDIFPCINKKIFNQNLEIDIYYLDHLDKQVTISIHSLTENNLTEYFGLVYDVTEKNAQAKIRQSLELELIRINRLSELGRRIEGIVHNLNTPLNSIIGFAQLLYEDNPNCNDIKKIIISAKNMSLIIKQLLQKTKDDSIAMPISININELIKQELSFCTHDLMFKHNVILDLQLSKNIPQVYLVYGDISQVFQIFFNNAIDAMMNIKDKKLYIKTFTENNKIAFSVKDTGIGISDKNLHQIFEIGFSTKALTTRSGFGLGLPLAKAIIEKLNGEIKIITEECKGAEFIVYIPLSN